MITEDDDLVPLSGLQHMVFCERQAALIHVEKAWRDNALTIEGNHLHRRVDAVKDRRELRGDLLVVRGLTLRSNALGLIGRADVVEFHRASGAGDDRGRVAVSLTGMTGLWVPFPVEYKRGRPKVNRCDEVQVCAQGMCLEEMLQADISTGALFYGQQKRRQPVVFDETLRQLVSDSARRLASLIATGTTPPAQYSPKCKNCSFLSTCDPGSRRPTSSESYCEMLFKTEEQHDES